MWGKPIVNVKTHSTATSQSGVWCMGGGCSVITYPKWKNSLNSLRRKKMYTKGTVRNSAMERCLALLVAGEMGTAVRCLGQLDGIREEAMMGSLSIPDNETCSHSRSTSAWYWSAVFPGEISVLQWQQDHPSGKWFISGQWILSKSLKKSQRATVSEHANCSKPVIRILDCSEKQQWYI